MSARRDRGALALLAVALIAFTSLSAAMPSVWSESTPISDVPHYREYGDAMEKGAVPYRDFEPEYPPGALAAFVVPSLASHGRVGFGRAFGIEMVLFGLAGIAVCFAAMRRLGLADVRLAAGLAPLAAAPVLLGPLVLERFDLFPAFLVTSALALLLAGRHRAGAAVLGLAIAVKVYPATLVPLVVAWIWHRRGRREAAVGLGLCALVVVAVFLPFLAVAPHGVASSVRGQLDRPLQIESVGSGVLLAAHHVFGMGLGWDNSHGSDNLSGAVAVAAAVVSTVAQIALLLWIWLRVAARRDATGATTLVDASLAALLAFVALGKVLSPQFLLWLMPVAALAAGRRAWIALVSLAVASGLTRGWFPDRYRLLVFHFDELASWLVLARDLVLVGLLAVFVAALRDPRAEAGSS
jgi:uncharacterized membrane protein YqaE (UPF0057 family)